MRGYFIGPIINSGAYATVHLITRKRDGQRFALKIFKKHKNTSKKEQDFMNTLQIYNKKIIVNKQIAIIMPFYGCQDLCSFFSHEDAFIYLSHIRKVELLYNILLQVESVNSVGIIHADVKLENFIVEHQFPLKLKLIDFGLSEKTIPGQDHVKLSEYKGTYEYMSPEVCDKMLYRNSDLFSVGVIAILIWTNGLCINNEYMYIEYKNIDYLKHAIHEDAYEFIKSTVTDHSNRLSVDELKKLKLFN